MKLYKITHQTVAGFGDVNEQYVFAENTTAALKTVFPNGTNAHRLETEFICYAENIKNIKLEKSNANKMLDAINEFKEKMLKAGFDAEKDKWIKIEFNK